jgi:hypothetical protein
MKDKAWNNLLLKHEKKGVLFYFFFNFGFLVLDVVETMKTFFNEIEPQFIVGKIF